MVYAYDLWAQLPVKDLYDSQMMATAIAAAKDRYDKSYEQMKDFRKEYGDFMSPFAKDMELYGKMVGGVHDLVDNALANGVDLYKSPEGRALIGRAINMVDPGLFNRMRANAKAGYAYLDAMQALKKAGKYSQEQEDFDIIQSGETPFDQFSSLGGTMWGRTSPIERADLGELSRPFYKDRTERLLNKSDFENDPRLKDKYKWNGAYDWYGYLYSDLMKVAPGAAAALKGDPRIAFFIDQAKKQVEARGEYASPEKIDAQFLKNIADANSWALIDPKRKANEFALENLKYKHQKDTANGNGKGGKEGEVASIKQALFNAGLSNYSGSTEPGKQSIDAAIKFGLTVMEKYPSYRKEMFFNRYYMKDAMSPELLASIFKNVPNKIDNESGVGGIKIDDVYDPSRLYTEDEVLNNTLGSGSGVWLHDEQNIKDLVNKNATEEKATTAKTTGGVWTAPMINGTHQQYLELNVEGADKPYYYLLTSSDPVPSDVIEGSGDLGVNIGFIGGRKLDYPDGFSSTPSMESITHWAANDNRVGSEAKLGADPAKVAGSVFLDLLQ